MAEHGVDDGQGEMDMSHGGMGGFRSQRDQQRQQEIEYYEEELSRLDDSYPCARNALELEIHRVRGGVMDMIDVVNNRKCKVRCRIAIPQDNFPGFNFVGKLLGQGGSTLKKLQEDCNVKMAILGRGSMRDPQKELEAFESGDPKYQHLKQALHLQIDCLDAPEEAYYRISRAIYEAKNIMTPDPGELAAAAAASGYGAPGPYPGGPVGGAGPRGRGRGGRGGRGGAPPVADYEGNGGYGGGGGGFGGYDGESVGYRGGSRGGGGGGGNRGGRGEFRGGAPRGSGASRGSGAPRGGGRGGFGGGGGDNGHGGGFGQDYGQSFGGGKAPPARGRGGPASRRGAHPYGRGM